MHKTLHVWAVAALLLLFGAALPAGADSSWKDTEGYRGLKKREVKALARLLKMAQKDSAARQAWYCADRILAADPDHRPALQMMDAFSAADVTRREEPKARLLKKIDGAVRKLGDDYFHFGETLDAAGLDPLDYYEISQRAHAYGSTAGALVAALRGAGYVWLGTFLDREGEQVQALIGTDLMNDVEFPPEFDDGLLKYRPLWPEAKVALWGERRILTDQDWKQGLTTIALVADVETWVIQKMGKGKPKGEITDFVVFKDIETFDKVAPDYVRERDRDQLAKRSSWYSSWNRRALVSAVERDNPWIAPDALVTGMVGRVLASTRLANGAGGWAHGKGAWLVEGVRGAFEGLRRTEDGFELDPKTCWRLAVARALRDEGQLLAWDEFFELSWGRMREVPREPSITIHVNGTPHEAKNVDVVAAQATAVVVGVFLSDRKKGPKHVAKLIAEFFKRDMLPSCDKTLKWKRGRTIEEADKAMDAIQVPDR